MCEQPCVRIKLPGCLPKRNVLVPPKTQIGLEDFRVQSYEAVDKYVVVVRLAWAYVEYRFAHERSAQIRTYDDIIRRHRDEHAMDWLKGAIEMAVETGDTDLVLQRFLRLEAQPA